MVIPGPLVSHPQKGVPLCPISTHQSCKTCSEYKDYNRHQPCPTSCLSKCWRTAFDTNIHKPCWKHHGNPWTNIVWVWRSLAFMGYVSTPVYHRLSVSSCHDNVVTTCDRHYDYDLMDILTTSSRAQLPDLSNSTIWKEELHVRMSLSGMHMQVKRHFKQNKQTDVTEQTRLT